VAAGQQRDTWSSPPSGPAQEAFGALSEMADDDDDEEEAKASYTTLVGFGLAGAVTNVDTGKMYRQVDKCAGLIKREDCTWFTHAVHDFVVALFKQNEAFMTQLEHIMKPSLALTYATWAERLFSPDTSNADRLALRDSLDALSGNFGNVLGNLGHALATEPGTLKKRAPNTKKGGKWAVVYEGLIASAKKLLGVRADRETVLGLVQKEVPAGSREAPRLAKLVDEINGRRFADGKETQSPCDCNNTDHTLLIAVPSL
jgi:hypothetical protein